MKKAALLILTLMFSVQSFAAGGGKNNWIRNLNSNVSITVQTVRGEERFLFNVCNAGRCEVLGSKEGYTEDQIDRLNGRVQQLGGLGLGVVEAAVIVYIGASALIIGAGEASVGGMVAGGVAGVGIPTTAIAFMKKINPIYNFRRGATKQRIEGGMDKLLASGKKALIIYENENFESTAKVAERVESVLKSL